MTPAADGTTVREGHDADPHAASGDVRASVAPGSTAPPGRRVVLALARSEMPRLLSHPLVLVSVIASALLIWWTFRAEAPVLDRDSVRLAGLFLPVAAAVLMASHGIASRSRRRATELLDSLPTAADRRVLGEFLAGLGPVAVAFVIVGAAMVFLAVGEPIGRWEWGELAAAPAMVILACALGVALAQWLPHRVSPVIVVVALAYLQAWTYPYTSWEISAEVGALAPFQQMDTWQPYAWQGRSGAAHAAWLLALTGVIVALSILRWRRGRDVTIALVAVAGLAMTAGAVSVTAVVNGATAQGHVRALTGDDTATADGTLDPEIFACAESDDVRICALEGFEGWIPRWHATWKRVHDVVPTSVERIVQSTPGVSRGTEDGPVGPRMHWDRAAGHAPHTFELAAQVAVGAVVTSETYGDFDEGWNMCTFGGEARAAVALWLATQDDPALIAELERRVERASPFIGGEILEDGTERRIVGPPELAIGWESIRTSLTVPDGELALAMSSLPHEEVRRVVTEHLDRWKDPSVSGADLARALDLPVPEVPEDEHPFAERCP